MKKAIYLMCAVLVGFFSSCEDSVKETVVYFINEPVFASANEIRSRAITVDAPQQIEEQGKLCLYKDYLYISEPGKGIHIIDNTTPAAPINAGFIELEGNTDIAIYNDKLYADHYRDLIYFDVTNPSKPKHIGRLDNAFEYVIPKTDPTDNYDYLACYTQIDKDKIVVGWNKVRREQTVEDFDEHKQMCDNISSGSSAGINGSMSRFSIHKGYLYTVMNHKMGIIDLNSVTPTKPVEDIPVDWQVETIFYYKDHMFLGTPFGMSIYLVANPLKREHMSTIGHITGYDPVVVENDLAFVTIHSNSFSSQNNNQLIIYDVSDVVYPQMLVSYTMTKPKGLAIENGILFICDDGLKIFDASDPMTLMAHQLAHYPGMEGYDLIPHNNVLMMIAHDGLYQYDYKDLTNISLLSKIGFKK